MLDVDASLPVLIQVARNVKIQLQRPHTVEPTCLIDKISGRVAEYREEHPEIITVFRINSLDMFLEQQISQETVGSPNAIHE